MNDVPDYWFPAKSYGWGWGLPTNWQGWLTLSLALLLFALASYAVPPRQHPLLFGLLLLGISMALLAVCLARGEPPSWRWGGN